MPDDAVLAVYFLDVGQGDCSFIIPPDDDAIVLFDCADAYVAERFVKDHGISHLGSVVISHLDRDHIGGMLPFLKAFLESGGSVGEVHVEIDRRLDESGLPSSKALLLEQLLRWEDENASGVVYPYRHRVKRGDPTRYRPQQESPCAGSAMLVLHSSGSLEFEPPPQSWHDEIVSLMDTPLCRQ